MLKKREIDRLTASQTAERCPQLSRDFRDKRELPCDFDRDFDLDLDLRKKASQFTLSQ